MIEIRAGFISLGALQDSATEVAQRLAWVQIAAITGIRDCTADGYRTPDGTKAFVFVGGHNDGYPSSHTVEELLDTLAGRYDSITNSFRRNVEAQEQRSMSCVTRDEAALSPAGDTLTEKNLTAVPA